MKKRIRYVALAVALSTAALSLNGCQIGNTKYVLNKEIIDDNIVFTIDEAECSLPEMKIYLCNYKNLYGSAYGIDLWDYEQTAEGLEGYVKDVTVSEAARIIAMGLLAQQKEISLTEDELATVNKAAEEYYESLTKDELDYTEAKREDVVKCYTDYALAQKLYNTLTEGVDEEVSDDEARVIRVRQIYVLTDEKADTVADKLKAGEDFLTVASTYNEAANIEITVARGDFPEAVENIAFNLDNEEVSDMIETDNGYYFIQCVNKFEEELTEANKEIILVDREKEQFEDLYTNFIKSTAYEFNNDVWSEVVFEEELDITTDSFFEVYEKYFGE